MKKKILSIFVFIISFSAYSQTQIISFEDTEGYSVGSIIGQQGWFLYWGAMDPSDAVVTNTMASQGTNSMNVLGTGSNFLNEEIRKSILSYSKTEYSFYYKIEAIGGSNYGMLITESGPANRRVAGFNIDPATGTLSVYNNDVIEGTTTAILPGVWYKFKMIVNMPEKTVAYFINDTSLGVKSVNTDAAGFDRISFAYNMNTGFTVDDIKITNMNATLGTSDVDIQNTLTISPNPTSDLITIKSQEKIDSVEILDVLGRIVFKNNKVEDQIRMSEFETGTYMIKINTEKGTITKKIIKK